MDCRGPDELTQTFYKKFQQAVDKGASKIPPEPRIVTFNPETSETSFGGTNTPGKIKDSSFLQRQVITRPTGLSTRKSNTDNTSRPAVNIVIDTANKTTKESKLANKNVQKENNSVPPLTAHDGPVCGTPTRSHLTAKRSNHETGSSLRTPVKQNTFDHFRTTAQTPDCFNPVSIETPMRKQRRSNDLIKTEDFGITVAVRVRPFSSREVTDPDKKKCVVSMTDNETVITTEKGDVHNFIYDYSFWSIDQNGGDFAGQEHVYNSLAQPMLHKVFEGYNTCLFAYGQTGSGKSYSIMGHNEEAGIIPRFCEDLFSRIILDKSQAKINVEISYFEIYNEKIHDLLGQSNKDKFSKKATLKVREHPTQGPYVEGLSGYVVDSFEDIESWLNVGNKHRATASTGMNDKSSRSHSVFTMVVTQSRTESIDGVNHNHSTTSKINLVDLAGSERQSHAKTSGDRLREGASINKSLMTLGKVISVLSEESTTNATKKKKLFIPYRDSVLTWLLKESLGGNSKTAMLATISPSSLHVEETLSTLRYAQQARSIINTARVNEDPKARLIRELRAEIEKLRSQTGTADDDVIIASKMEIDSLREKLLEREHEMAKMSKSWQEKLKKSEERILEESRHLEKSGIAFKVDHKLPNLVNLNEDPQLSEVLLYVLKEGQTKVGRIAGRTDIDIQLSGPLIADEHCIFNYESKKVAKMTVTPIGDAPTYVNGNLIAASTALQHGDRVIIGGDHYFRFSHPSDVPSSQRKSYVHQDFQYAQQELNHVQNARLEAELEEARKKHEEALQKELKRQESEANRRMDEELARSKLQADQQIQSQRYKYENKLADLAKMMQEHRKKQFESDKSREMAEEAIRKLEEQKMILEQEVLANRKRLDMEAKAAQTAFQEVSRVSHCKLVEHLEKEKMKMQKDFEKIVAYKQQRESGALTPRAITPRTPTIQDSNKRDLYRTMLKVREANKISQHLNKQTVFSREDVTSDNSEQSLIKVTNSKLGISTLWTMDKFEEKLVQMREIYQINENDNNTGESEEVFYDPNDTWERNDQLKTPQGVSPRVLQSLRRQVSKERIPRLTFTSMSSASTVGSRSRTETCSLGSVAEVTESRQGPSVLDVCHDQITAASENFKGSVLRECIPDKVFGHCDLIKKTIAAMLDTYRSESDVGRSKAKFTDNVAIEVSSTELTSSLQIIMSLSAVWLHSVEAHNSTHVRELYDKIIHLIKRLASHMLLFLQGFKNNIESMVEESSRYITDALNNICQMGGEIVIAMETPLLCLGDQADGSMLEEDDCRYHLAPDTKQFITSGTEVFLARTLSLSLMNIEDCGSTLLGFSDKLSVGCRMSNNIVKQGQLIVSASKALVKRLHTSQTTRKKPVREDSYESKKENFYNWNYLRHQSLIKQLMALTDGVSLLVETSEEFIEGNDEGSLHRVSGCSDIINKAVEIIQSMSSEDTSFMVFDSQSHLQCLQIKKAARSLRILIQSGSKG